MREARGRAEQQLAQLAAIRQELRDDASDPDGAYRLMTVSAGEHSARATLDWAEETLAALAALPAPSADGTPPASPHPTEEHP